MEFKDLADLVFPEAKDISYYEEKYPVRNLPEGAYVTRFAPSPTGFMHIGNLFAGILDEKMAKQTNGIFLLRIEDTDQKREVENGVEQIIKGLEGFGIASDEGVEIGDYAPYKQSERKDIYQAYAKSLLEKGLAYPCFCSPENLEENRASQEKAKVRPGYYGVWAKCRNIPIDEAIERIQGGEKHIIRFKSNGREDRKIEHKDCVKGKIDFPENDQDIVIIKADGLPTYHFAHAIDDHLMRVTHVIRGDEWISSLPLHLELFRTLGFRPPKYAHIAPIVKIDGESKRKLSKRKDPEA
ncbi:MAG: glutamate--tRNA ligase family protein, partial [Oscillospiraceae bacterium]|nr:glutamate--tRNA ligase family protein [Oscillospiraceae bacterium]